jgi:alpha-glucosidase
MSLITIFHPHNHVVRSYNSTIFGPSGNITVNGKLTCRLNTPQVSTFIVNKRGLGAGQQKGVDLNAPPYAIHNGELGTLKLHGS